MLEIRFKSYYTATGDKGLAILCLRFPAGGLEAKLTIRMPLQFYVVDSHVMT